MPYLIDGHNLIGQMRSLSLADPDDEAKLVQLLKRFAARRRKQITVVFDKGVLGGRSSLSAGRVEVRFASTASNADAVLRRRVRELKDAPNWTVVTSDNEVASAARSRGARVMSSADFAAELTAGAAPSAEKGQPNLSAAEVAQWEAEFSKGKKPRRA